MRAWCRIPVATSAHPPADLQLHVSEDFTTVLRQDAISRSICWLSVVVFWAVYSGAFSCIDIKCGRRVGL
jgi:hypothetical protein